MIKFFIVFHERSVSLALKYLDQESSSNYKLSSTQVESRSTLLVILMCKLDFYLCFGNTAMELGATDLYNEHKCVHEQFPSRIQMHLHNTVAFGGLI